MIPPFLFKYEDDDLIIFKVKSVPSEPVLQGTFLNQIDFFAITSEIPDTSFMIKSNFYFPKVLIMIHFLIQNCIHASENFFLHI